MAPAKAPALIKLRMCVTGDKIVLATCEAAFGKRIPNLYAVTDSIGAAGLKDGDYQFANTQITKNWRRPKACDFLTFNLCSFHTFCDILVYWECMKVKI